MGLSFSVDAIASSRETLVQRPAQRAAFWRAVAQSTFGWVGERRPSPAAAVHSCHQNIKINNAKQSVRVTHVRSYRCLHVSRLFACVLIARAFTFTSKRPAETQTDIHASGMLGRHFGSIERSDAQVERHAVECNAESFTQMLTCSCVAPFLLSLPPSPFFHLSPTPYCYFSVVLIPYDSTIVAHPKGVC